MKIGVNVQNGQPWTTAETIGMLGARAEELGFDSVWVSDHVVIPERIESTYPYGGPGTFTPANRGNYFEAVAVLAFLAGRTRRVQLGVSVLVVPQRPPLLIAKQWATLDALAGGRTILGVGAGWMREEFVALGAETFFERRGKALDEAIRIFRTVWSQPGTVSSDGEVYRFEPLRADPKPAQEGGPPIWIGGHGRRSLRRAAELGNGWQGVRMGLEEWSAARATLEELLGRYNRTLDDLELAMALAAYAPGKRPAEPADADLVGSADEMAERVRQYAALGIQHVLLQPQPQDSAASVAEAIEFFAREVRPRLTD